MRKRHMRKFQSLSFIYKISHIEPQKERSKLVNNELLEHHTEI